MKYSVMRNGKEYICLRKDTADRRNTKQAFIEADYYKRFTANMLENEHLRYDRQCIDAQVRID